MTRNILRSYFKGVAKADEFSIVRGESSRAYSRVRSRHLHGNIFGGGEGTGGRGQVEQGAAWPEYLPDPEENGGSYILRWLSLTRITREINLEDDFDRATQRNFRGTRSLSVAHRSTISVGSARKYDQLKFNRHAEQAWETAHWRIIYEAVQRYAKSVDVTINWRHGHFHGAPPWHLNGENFINKCAPRVYHLLLSWFLRWSGDRYFAWWFVWKSAESKIISIRVRNEVLCVIHAWTNNFQQHEAKIAKFETR